MAWTRSCWGKLLPLAGELGTENSAAMQLLNALRPFLKEEKARENPTGGTAGAADPCGEEAVGGLGG
ncbi:MAG: hypothetical protein ACLSHM_01690 [Vescimonas sp.]